ncbi:GNAT family N-acetyltransferase [Allokutzneria albata]|uniref:Acetyltransferase (GNAT) family protein n=1 Tax=Allokutzneria albata TaxID=211114 RepID=A0A1G9T8R3_ALLAB|nr:GNAT family N-acetyltransferase [Allokutzneria albata]SDM44012.1 Acetyltransferase (GNAT) family protein [Allokutzneria albata]
MNPRIIVATENDVDGLVSSVEGLFAEDGGRRDPFMDTGWPAREGAAYYADLVGQPDALCLLAGKDQVAGHLVGLIRRSSLRPGAVTGVLESMRVAPASRRRGIGSALIERFFDWAAGCGANEFSVSAYSSNEAALALYRKHGFVPFETKLTRGSFR